MLANLENKQLKLKNKVSLEAKKWSFSLRPYLLPLKWACKKVVDKSFPRYTKPGFYKYKNWKKKKKCLYDLQNLT